MQELTLRLMNGYLLYNDRKKLLELFDLMEKQGLIESVGLGNFTRSYREIETEFLLPLYIEETTIPKQLDIDIALIKKICQKSWRKNKFCKYQF